MRMMKFRVQFQNTDFFSPDRVYTVGSAGVWYSSNFGLTWRNATMEINRII